MMNPRVFLMVNRGVLEGKPPTRGQSHITLGPHGPLFDKYTSI